MVCLTMLVNKRIPKWALVKTVAMHMMRARSQRNTLIKWKLSTKMTKKKNLHMCVLSPTHNNCGLVHRTREQERTYWHKGLEHDAHCYVQGVEPRHNASFNPEEREVAYNTEFVMQTNNKGRGNGARRGVFR